MNTVERLEFELIFYDIAVQGINYYTMKIPRK